MTEHGEVATMGFAADLQSLLGLEKVKYKYNLDKRELFGEAIANDRGRTREGGPRDAPKAFATKLGADGPLVYYTDPSATGRRVKDTFAVAWPEIEGQVWWKDNLQKYDPDHYEGLLARVVRHLNERGRPLYVQDVFAGADASYSVPYRFVGEYACKSGEDCKEPIETDFFELAEQQGTYQTTIAVESGKVLSVTLDKQ